MEKLTISDLLDLHNLRMYYLRHQKVLYNLVKVFYQKILEKAQMVLEEQMLNIVVKIEEPAKDEQRQRNIKEFFENKNKQQMRIIFYNYKFQISPYESICRSLQEKDKLIFLFSITMKLMLRLLHKRFVLLWKYTDPTFNLPQTESISKKTLWCLIIESADVLTYFKEFPQSFTKNLDSWQEIQYCSEPQSQKLPEPRLHLYQDHELMILFTDYTQLIMDRQMEHIYILIQSFLLVDYKILLQISYSFVDRARRDEENRCLNENLTKILQYSLPYLWLLLTKERFVSRYIC